MPLELLVRPPCVSCRALLGSVCMHKTLGRNVTTHRFSFLFFFLRLTIVDPALSQNLQLRAAGIPSERIEEWSQM
jgi:hypothetical protein